MSVVLFQLLVSVFTLWELLKSRRLRNVTTVRSSCEYSCFVFYIFEAQTQSISQNNALNMKSTD